MLLTVKGKLEELNVETYVCTFKGCEQQAILYSGGRNLTLDIRNHYK